MTEPLKPLANKKKESKVEQAKKESNFLRGGLAESLQEGSDTFGGDDVQVLKFHGIYQQDDRDARDANKALGGGRENSFMARVKIPGGQLTAEQYLALDQLAEELNSYRSLRLTTRQAIQIHGVVKSDLKQLIQRIDEVLLSTLCGCGDISRNVMGVPAPFASPGHEAARGLAGEISKAMEPRTTAYAEVWLDGEKVATTETEEPIYGPQYLPRKFKIGVGLPDDNSVDVHSQDVGLLAIIENDQLVGVNVLVGGGLGMTHRKEETYARLGTPLGFVEPEHVVPLVQTIATMHRDYGDRTDRKHARLKYVVEEQGVDAFREELVRRADFTLHDWRDVGEVQHQDWLGQHEQGDGKFFYGVQIPSGRVVDHDVRYKTAFARIVRELGPRVIATPNQNLLFADLSEDDVKAIERVLKAYQITLPDQLTATRRYAMACPALPTCPLALTESERIMPDVVDAFERELGRLGLENEP
ncbi:MAG: NADPH-dependent assimilatory sulfite reductase hemoprotein subunit, partial [Phycisphaeraceae bacterium]